MKDVFAVTVKNGKNYWRKVGLASVEPDGSISVELDALPISGKLMIRDRAQSHVMVTGEFND